MNSRLTIETIKEIVDEGLIVNKKENELLNELNKIVIEYIKKKGLIVYGGTAINALLMQKKDKIYEKDDTLDYDFMTPNVETDVIELAQIFYKKNFKYVHAISALHQNTYRIRIEFDPELTTDISWIPEKIFNNMPTVTIKGIKYISHEVQIINLFLSLIDIHNIFRWDKDIIRLNKILKYYPIHYVNEEMNTVNEKMNTVNGGTLKKANQKTNKKANQKIDDLTRKFIYKQECIISGFDAYNQHIQILMKSPKIVPNYYMSVYSIDPEKLAEKYVAYIKKHTKGTVSIKKHSWFLDYFPNSYHIYDDKTLLLIIYDSIEINTKKINGIQYVSVAYLIYALLVEHLRNITLNVHTSMKTILNNMVYFLFNNDVSEKNPFYFIDLTQKYDRQNTDIYKGNIDMFYGSRKLLNYKPEINFEPDNINVDKKSISGSEIKQ